MLLTRLLRARNALHSRGRLSASLASGHLTASCVTTCSRDPVAPDATLWEPLRLGLRDLGYVEGKSIALEERSSRGRNERLSDLASELTKEDIMRMLRGFLALVLLLGTVPVVWVQADPAKEVADIRAKQGAAGAKGEVDGVMAPMADNVVFTAARAGFRIDGKEAVPDVGQDRRSPAAR